MIYRYAASPAQPTAFLAPAASPSPSPRPLISLARLLTMCCSPDCLLAFLAVLFPPIAVWVKVGLCCADSLINIALCCLGYVPGLVHAWYIILKHPDELAAAEPTAYAPVAPGDIDDLVDAPSGGRGRIVSRDAEGGRVIYYYIAPRSGSRRERERREGGRGGYQQVRPPVAVPRGYGTVSPPAEGVVGVGGSGEGGSGGAQEERQPPTYAEAVRGDHKIQHD